MRMPDGEILVGTAKHLIKEPGGVEPPVRLADLDQVLGAMEGFPADQAGTGDPGQRPLNETADDSSIMHRLMENLDSLAGKLQVPKLSDFYDYSELERAYADLDPASEEGPATDEDEIQEPSLEERQTMGRWFDSKAGLKSVQALREHLQEHFDDLDFTPNDAKAHWPRQLMDELTKTESILKEAAARGQQFRLLIVP